jgi:hypothetical protein
LGRTPWRPGNDYLGFLGLNGPIRPAIPPLIDPILPAMLSGIVRRPGMLETSFTGANAGRCGATVRRRLETIGRSGIGRDGVVISTVGGLPMRGGGGKLPTARARERGIGLGFWVILSGWGWTGYRMMGYFRQLRS